MAVVSVPSGDWTSVANTAGTYILTSTEDFWYQVDAEEPTVSSEGHFGAKYKNEEITIGDGQELWVYKANGGFSIAVSEKETPALGEIEIGDVGITGSLPAGTNNIGDVDVLSLPALPTGSNLIGRVIAEGAEYETVAASASTQALGATGATGDYLAGVLIIPATTSPGAVAIKDGANGAITVFTGGASSVSNLVPFFVPLGIISVAGAWQITTGDNVSVIGVGNFT